MKIKEYFSNISPKKILELIGILSIAIPTYAFLSEIGTCFIICLYGSLMSLMIGFSLYFRIRKRSLSKYLRYLLLVTGVITTYLVVDMAYIQKLGILTFNVAFMVLAALGGWSFMIAGLDYAKRYHEKKDLHPLFVSIICFGHGVPLTLLSSFLISMGIMTSI